MSAISNSRRRRPGTRSELDMKSHSLDHLVRERQKIIGNLYTKCLCSLEVNYELELSHLHHRQVGRLLALENAANVKAHQSVHLGDAGPIAHQAAGHRIFAKLINRRHSML